MLANKNLPLQCHPSNDIDKDKIFGKIIKEVIAFSIQEMIIIR